MGGGGGGGGMVIIVLSQVLTLCTRSAHLCAYVIYLAYARCTFICTGVTVAKPSKTSG